MNKRDSAKKLLVHYFRLLYEQSDIVMSFDMDTEIEEIVDLIIDAAIDETTRIMIKYFQGESK